MIRRFTLALLGVTLAMNAAAAAGPGAWLLLTNAQVDSEGVFLAQVVTPDPAAPLPPVRLADAPVFGQAAVLSRAQIEEAIQKVAPALALPGWTGAGQVRLTRRSRVLAEAEVRELLTSALQRDFVKDKGDLEIRLLRPWAPMLAPDEPLAVRVVDLPGTGVSASCIVRFELSTRKETLGPWQAPLVTKIWRDVWVARGPIRREALFTEADVARERRDVLNVRDLLLPSLPMDSAIEFAENVSAGSVIYLRSVRLRPVIRRGQLVDAHLRDGPMQISLRVEVLESGAPGQFVRVRNPQSRREFKGKVQDEQTVVISF
jgi:flagella basal body P-ring formation protein FlgA